MITAFRLAVAASVLLCAGAASAVDPAGQAHDFVVRLFAMYGQGLKDAPSREQPYDKAMLALMDENDRLTPAGDAGSLDWDPLCQCQDWGKLVAQATVKLTSPTAATAEVTFRDVQWGDAPRHATFDLVFEDGHWRIHDIHSKDFKDGSMRTYLTTENQRMRRESP
jgi:hypothetical protein